MAAPTTYVDYEALPPSGPLTAEPAVVVVTPSTLPQQRRDKNGTGAWTGGVSLAKAVLGVGILVLPAIVARIGMASALIYLAFIAVLTYFSLHFLTVASARSGFLRYTDVARAYTGLPGSIMVDLSLIINCAGLLIVYYIILGDLLVGNGHSPGLLSHACGDRGTVLGVLTLLLIVPLVSAVKMKSVAGVSALGVTAIMVWAAITVFLFVIALTNGQLHTLHWWPQGRYIGHGFESAVQTIAILPIILVAFICQQTLQHVLRDMNDASSGELQVGALSGTTLAVAVAAFLAIGISGAGLFGSDVDADVLKNYTVAALQPYVWTQAAQAVFMTVRLAFVISLVASFPLQMAPLRDAFWKLFFRQELQGPGLWLVTYGLLAVIYFVGVAARSIWEPLLIIGSTAGVMLAFIMPGILALKVENRLMDRDSARYGRVLGGSALILVGLVIGVFGLLRVFLYRDQLGA